MDVSLPILGLSLVNFSFWHKWVRKILSDDIRYRCHPAFNTYSREIFPQPLNCEANYDYQNNFCWFYGSDKWLTANPAGKELRVSSPIRYTTVITLLKLRILHIYIYMYMYMYMCMCMRMCMCMYMYIYNVYLIYTWGILRELLDHLLPCCQSEVQDSC